MEPDAYLALASMPLTPPPYHNAFQPLEPAVHDHHALQEFKDLDDTSNIASLRLGIGPSVFVTSGSKQYPDADHAFKEGPASSKCFTQGQTSNVDERDPQTNFPGIIPEFLPVESDEQSPGASSRRSRVTPRRSRPKRAGSSSMHTGKQASAVAPPAQRLEASDPLLSSFWTAESINDTLEAVCPDVAYTKGYPRSGKGEKVRRRYVACRECRTRKVCPPYVVICSIADSFIT